VSRSAALAAVLAAVSSLTLHAQAPPRPVVTPGLHGLAPGRLGLALGIEREGNVRFPLSGLRGDLLELGAFTLRVPASDNVEVRITGTYRGILSIHERGTSYVRLDIDTINNRTSDMGDIVVGTVVRVVDEEGSLPAVGVWAGARLPNANETKGIGTNTTDLYFAVLLGKHLGRLELTGSFGIGIYDDPLDAFNENDVVLYGLSAVGPLGPDTRLFADLNGWVSSRVTTPIGTEPRGQLRAGVDRRVGRFIIDASAFVGLTEVTADWGLAVGTSIEVGSRAAGP
jgi:hypothetical protein